MEQNDHGGNRQRIFAIVSPLEQICRKKQDHHDHGTACGNAEVGHLSVCKNQSDTGRNKDAFGNAGMFEKTDQCHAQNRDMKTADREQMTDTALLIELSDVNIK